MKTVSSVSKRVWFRDPPSPPYTQLRLAAVAELADVQDLGSCALCVWVRLPPAAPRMAYITISFHISIRPRWNAPLNIPPAATVQFGRHFCTSSLMAEHQPSKLIARVRFPLGAPTERRAEKKKLTGARLKDGLGKAPQITKMRPLGLIRTFSSVGQSTRLITARS